MAKLCILFSNLVLLFLLSFSVQQLIIISRYFYKPIDKYRNYDIYLFLTKYHGAYLIFVNKCTLSILKDKARLQLVCIYVCTSSNCWDYGYPCHCRGYIHFIYNFAKQSRKFIFRLFSIIRAYCTSYIIVKRAYLTNYTII